MENVNKKLKDEIMDEIFFNNYCKNQDFKLSEEYSFTFIFFLYNVCILVLRSLIIHNA